jgi:hypothetical protein
MELRPHESSLPIAVTVRASLEVVRAEARLRFDVEGDLGALAIPPPSRAPARRDRLWEHTCLEAFVGPADGAPYLEVNLSPSGDWAVWSFDGYREAMRPAEHVRSLPSLTSRDETLRLEASVPLPPSAGWHDTKLRAGLAAVLESRDGRFSYWACAHPSSQPDFHAREGWPILVYAPARA